MVSLMCVFCKGKKKKLILTGVFLGHLAEAKTLPLWRDIPSTHPAQAAFRILVEFERKVQVAKHTRKPAGSEQQE